MQKQILVKTYKGTQQQADRGIPDRCRKDGGSGLFSNRANLGARHLWLRSVFVAIFRLLHHYWHRRSLFTCSLSNLPGTLSVTYELRL